MENLEICEHKSVYVAFDILHEYRNKMDQIKESELSLDVRKIISKFRNPRESDTNQDTNEEICEIKPQIAKKRLENPENDPKTSENLEFEDNFGKFKKNRSFKNFRQEKTISTCRIGDSRKGEIG